MLLVKNWGLQHCRETSINSRIPVRPGGINPDHPSYGADLTILGQCSHRTAFALPLKYSNVKYAFPPLGARPFAAEKIYTPSAARRQPICGPKGFRFNLAPQTTISKFSGTMLPPRLLLDLLMAVCGAPFPQMGCCRVAAKVCTFSV